MNTRLAELSATIIASCNRASASRDSRVRLVPKWSAWSDGLAALLLVTLSLVPMASVHAAGGTMQIVVTQTRNAVE